MKTSVIEVHDMLSVLSVDGVEKRIGEVPGVESVTVNFAAGSATVRYDETRLDVADIKSDVRQRGYESAGESLPKHVSEHSPAGKRAAGSTPEVAPASASAPEAAAPEAAAPKDAPIAAALTTPAADVPKAAPGAPAAEAKAAPAAPAAERHTGHAAPGAPNSLLVQPALAETIR